MTPRQPRPLRPGDRVAVVAPSGPVSPERLEAGVRILRSWGLDVVLGDHVLTRDPVLPYLAGTDRQRAADLQAAWTDPSVAAVVCARGGYGAQRIVDRLDWPALAAAGPRWFVGYSDATALHQAISTRLGLATLYGPMAAAQVFTTDADTADGLRDALFGKPVELRGRALTPGRAEAPTSGGCLALLATDLGTPSAGAPGTPSAGAPGTPSAAAEAAGAYAGTIVCLEDVGEPAYAIDRWLTQLLRAGAFDGVAGFALGSWERCERQTPELVDRVLADRLRPLGIPIAVDLPFGHGPSSATVPLGVPAVLADGVLTFAGRT
ncbi:S66 peptidase family protein [Phaeacidiphilus oryzae]|uniref:S66 peptidase family protein n=1 Tax=Phaeacidiphilus oryzae TaxID=348818 RepID=UPI00055B0E61|nr:LD-carboxypeptidase [Phaeacidiphilus oryzae]